ncbi:PHD finger protein 11, partial [Calypte anna]
GVFWIMAKMVRRTCAFCPEGEAGSVLYLAKERNIAAHQHCLLFSSGFVESEEYNPDNLDIRFDVASVLKELKRGKRLVRSNFCRKKGATVGCEERACRRSYHYFCALCDDAAIETDEVNGVYRYLIKYFSHSSCCASSKLLQIRLLSFILEEVRGYDFLSSHENCKRSAPSLKSTPNLTCFKHLPTVPTAAPLRIDFLRKCKQAGLLDDIFEEMLDTLHLAQEKLMDDNTSETEYEETVISLFDCGLFENILTNTHSGTEEKLQELLESRKKLDNKIELLQDLKEVV